MGGGTIYAITFYVTAAVAVASAFMVVWHKNPVINALYLVVCFFAVAVDYVLLHAHFLAAVQVLLYAGAVLVLFLMIIMLMDLHRDVAKRARPTMAKAVALAVVFGFTILVALAAISLDTKLPAGQNPKKIGALLLSLGVKATDLPVPVSEAEAAGLSEQDKVETARNLLEFMEDPQPKSYFVLPASMENKITPEKLDDLRKDLIKQLSNLGNLEALTPPPEFVMFEPAQMKDYIAASGLARLSEFRDFGTTRAVGQFLFSRYMLPFEAASILLFAAIIGVLVLARRAPAPGGK